MNKVIAMQSITQTQQLLNLKDEMQPLHQQQDIIILFESSVFITSVCYESILDFYVKV